MHLIPTNEEVITMLRQTGALRDGHFEYSNGMHADEFLQVALAFRYYEWAKILSVGLSRRLRADTEIRAMIKELSIVAPTTGGLPIAYGVCEALRAHQVYWAESGHEDHERMEFRQFIEPTEGEKVLLVDDILRSGKRLTALRSLVESKGAKVVGLAVAVYQPNPTIVSFDNLPLFYLAQMDATYYKDAQSCELCKKGVPIQKIWA
ncbi:MAG TPA: phosphoribosyltransferase family protein [Bryobacteraceae bacterium]|nr:phosphoribosyltransferase family protein [Bryobacteraceae bacterium]